MNPFRVFLPTALIAVLAGSCMSNDGPPPLPQLEISKQYNATDLHSEGIHIGIRGKWLLWEQDSVLIKSYMNRVIGEENNPGFLPILKTQPAPEVQRLSFTNELATLLENGQSTPYLYQVASGSPLLWLRQRDTLTYYENERPALVSKLGHFVPVYYKKEPAPAESGFKYQVKTLPERYFTIKTGELQAPGLLYHLRKYDEVEDFGKVQNYLGDQPTILQTLEVGDTLLIQLYQQDFNY